MSLFGNRYAKEGKGVEKRTGDESKLKIFFEIYFRKFWKLCEVSLLYLIACIPTFVVMMILSGFISSRVINTLMPLMESIIGESGVESGLMVAYSALFDLAIRLIISSVVTALWGMGPVTAGYTYILRNYSREEHAWVWSDFWEHTWKNFKQSICVWIIDVLAFTVLVCAFLFYSSQPGILGVMKYVVVSIFLLYTIMHFYLYQMIVTFDMKLKDIYKNSFLFTFVVLPKNFLVLIAVMVIHLIFPYLGINFGYFAGKLGFWAVYIAFAIFVLQSLSGLIINFSAHYTIKKYMLDAIKQTKEENN